MATNHAAVFTQNLKSVADSFNAARSPADPESNALWNDLCFEYRLSRAERVMAADRLYSYFSDEVKSIMEAQRIARLETVLAEPPAEPVEVFISPIKPAVPPKIKRGNLPVLGKSRPKPGVAAVPLVSQPEAMAIINRLSNQLDMLTDQLKRQAAAKHA